MSALEVADIFRRHGEAYREAHAGHLSRTERRVMGAIEACRTAALGGHVERCAECGLIRIAYNSCRNRHCPKCQGPARAAWIVERQTELLPVPYFHVVFTLPAPAAEIAFQNKTAVYAILFRAAAEALSTIRAISAPRSALSLCSTPGAKTCSTIRTCIAWFPAAACRWTAGPGFPVGPASFCRCGCCRGCSWRSYGPPSMPAGWRSSARWPASPPHRP